MLLVTVASLSLGGCGQLDIPWGSLLYDVQITPQVITPNADGDNDVAIIQYNLRRTATLDIYFEGTSGSRYYFRKAQRRAPDQYEVFWGGAIDDRHTVERDFGPQEILSYVLPNDTYSWTVAATDDSGQVESVVGQITLQDGDTVMPELRSFVVTPSEFTPNQDSIGDEVSIAYYLSKDVETKLVYLISLQNPALRTFVEEAPAVVKPTEFGFHSHKYNGGMDLNAEPPLDGNYVVSVEVHDRAGNAVLVSQPLTVTESGKPRADIAAGEITWYGEQPEVNRNVSAPVGKKLCFETVIVNEGAVPIRTSGPWPGQEYNFSQNFNALAAQIDQSWYQQAGVFRFAINFDTAQSDFPFRWAVGRQEELEKRIIDGREQWYLMPGKRGKVSGCILFDVERPVGTNLWWGGLIHEFVDVPNNYVDRISVQ